ncbi:MAG TPA: hypothetical protein VMW19_16620 [Myxococcota bacterium]|nr:hypothetical protein [Myxococcota bacterium]
MIGASTRRRVLPAVAALGILLRCAASIAQETEERVVPNWVPSVGFGFGIQSREINGNIDAILFTNQTGQPPSVTIPCQTQTLSMPPPLPPFVGFCNLGGAANRASDGAAFDLSGQILGPPWKSAPWKLRPRPFVHGGFAFEYDSRTIVEVGINPSSFQNAALEPLAHTRLRANPNWIGFAGGGVALQLPIEFTPVFLKLGAVFTEEQLDAVGTIDRGGNDVNNKLFTVSNDRTEALKIPGVGPSVGVEAEVWRFGPIALQFVADLLVSFPLSDDKTSFDLDQPVFPGDPPSCVTNPTAVPCVNPGHFDFKADNPSFFGVASLRFGWVGY